MTLIALAQGCGGKPCTLIGCHDSTDLDVSASEVELRGAHFVFRINGAAIGECLEERCSGAVVIPSSSSVISHEGFAATVRDGRWLGFSYSTGRALPSSAVLEIEVDGALLVRKALSLQTSSFAPNGEECGPVCHAATGSFSLSASDALPE